MNKQQLAAKIWESANQMRSKIEANEYKDYILGFIFYKYLSDLEVKFAKKEGFAAADIAALSEADSVTMNYIKGNIGYFIAYPDLFSSWIKMGRDFDVANVRDALSAFNRLINPVHKKLFSGIFDTLQTGLSKLGESSAAQTKAISELIHLIKDIPMDGRQDYDVLGFIYEYLISMFAANAGKKAGEFYTPHEVSVLMSEIVADHLKDKSEIAIYDPTSGSGSLLINIGQSVAKHIDDENKIKYYAQELKQNTYNLTRMNLIMRGILVDNIVTRNGDTLADDWPFFDENDPVNSYDPLYVDAVVSNPPYSQQWDPSNKETDPRYRRFGTAPKSKADYAFLLHDLYHLKPDGIMTIVLPHGVLFRGGEEGQIRKNLIEGNHIETIIGLPANIFFGTGIPTTILVLKQQRDNTEVLIVDASKGFEKVGKNNKLRAADIKRIADTVIHRQTSPNYAKVVSRAEIRQNDYNLNIPRYVDSTEQAERWDLYATMFGGIPEAELDQLDQFWTAFPGLRADLFAEISGAYVHIKVADVKQTIREHTEVQGFIKGFAAAFGDFDALLRQELLARMATVKISREETILSDDIFKRLAAVPLIDRYQAYQLLDDQWTQIATDLEVLQTEGLAAAKKVDPNMVVKKKNGKDVEVQEGWRGHVLPFELVQTTYLQDETQQLRQHENRLREITAAYEEILDALSEEEKEAATINEAGDAFVSKAVAQEVKAIKAAIKKSGAVGADSYEARILTVGGLLAEEKELKKQVKAVATALHQHTKATIEALSDEQLRELLELKWITPLVAKLKGLPETVVSDLAARVQTLSEKYATTFMEVEAQIHEAEAVLSSLIDELDGNAYDLAGLAEFQKLLSGE